MDGYRGMIEFNPTDKNDAIQFIQLQLWDLIHSGEIDVLEGKAIIAMLEALKELR